MQYSNILALLELSCEFEPKGFYDIITQLII